jgi:hypothetical protein
LIYKIVKFEMQNTRRNENAGSGKELDYEKPDGGYGWIIVMAACVRGNFSKCNQLTQIIF